MAIDLKNFSLGMVQISVERYTGSYANGLYTRVLDGGASFSAWASVQPYTTIEADLISFANMGDRVSERLIMFIKEEIFMNDSTDSNPTSDIVVVDGKKYKPVKVDNWDFLGNSHYRVLLSLFDGY